MIHPNPKKKAAVISAEGFGDGLLMLIAAKFLTHQNFEVTVFNKNLFSLKPLLPFFDISSYLEEEKSYLAFDLVLLQNDNSPRSKKIISLRSNPSFNLQVFYPSYTESKHGPLNRKDFIFNSTLPMAENIAISCETMFPQDKCDKSIGLILPQDKIHRKFKKRVAIHPSSGSFQKNWPPEKFLKLYGKISKYGYEPVFVISNQEKKIFANHFNLSIQSFNSLSDLCFFLYESGFFIGNDSGPGHLASYLQIPSIIIADNKKRMNLWQPGWKKAKIITPLSLIPNIKNLRLRQEKWKFFIPSFSVFQAFKTLSNS